MPPPNADPLLWIDNSLSPDVAKALRLVGYRTVVQSEVPEFTGLTRVLDDRHIIPWLDERDGVWVHADDSAYTDHKHNLLASQVRTVWVYRPGGVMSTRQMLRVLAYTLPAILDDLTRAEPRSRHWKISTTGAMPHDRIRLEPFILSA